MKTLSYSILLLLSLVGCNVTNEIAHNPNNSIEKKHSVMPFAPNIWVENNAEATTNLVDIKTMELKNWGRSAEKVTLYFNSETTDTLNYSLIGNFPPTGELAITHDNQHKVVSFNTAENGVIALGEFTVTKPGYQKITFEHSGILISDDLSINKMKVAGVNTANTLRFITEQEVYFARRGPSAHLKYELPAKDKNWEWFYSELTVPKGFDPIGSYFMANGFAQGYFGMQVNSASDRRVLFSVWSPFDSQDPIKVPDDQKIKLLKKGPGVYSGKFGNEGVGGQSFRPFNWKVDTTYKFLINVTPKENNFTEFTAYFYAPELAQWTIIASFERPKTQSYVQRPYAFIENFVPSKGDVVRKALYSNQWVADTQGEWHKISFANVTYDNTARNGFRLDYQGGTEIDSFYLQNGGFFNEPTPLNKTFEIRSQQKSPTIDFDLLRKL